jgi:O-succinylbenzoate synthase
MAKAGLETAIWDLYGKRNNRSIAEMIGGERKQVAAGAVVAAKNKKEAIEQIGKFHDLGYQRIKIKIQPGLDYSYIKEIRHQFPDLPLMVDANSAYSLDDVKKLQALDEFQLMMIEQPLGDDDLVEHAILQKQIQTPICLDESIVSFHDAESAIQLGSCQVMNVKIGRVGGLQNALDIHHLCRKNQIQLWCGGMIEFGISKAFNLALASLPGFTLPGDIPASTNYWEEDITEPEIEVKNGWISVPDKAGIGFSINQKRLHAVTVHREIYQKRAV